MRIEKLQDGATLTLALEGRLDTTTAPELEDNIKTISADVTKLILDMKRLDYLSSAGLRVVLGAQKMMSKQGEMVVHNVNEEIMEIFEMTGFSDILTIQ